MENVPKTGVTEAIRAPENRLARHGNGLHHGGRRNNNRVEILTYTMGGPDADSFSIDRSTAQISTKADVALDTETKDTYTVTVTATDPSGLQATITVTITVTNVDEAPEIMLGGLGISGMRTVEYAENGTDAVSLPIWWLAPKAASATVVPGWPETMR